LVNIDIFYGHLEYFMDIWDILWPFGTFCVHLVHFFQFWCHAPRKIWQPCIRLQSCQWNFQGWNSLRKTPQTDTINKFVNLGTYICIICYIVCM
jgi:hypothetical protein